MNFAGNVINNLQYPDLNFITLNLPVRICHFPPSFQHFISIINSGFERDRVGQK